jgi:hypothetical protein
MNDGGPQTFKGEVTKGETHIKFLVGVDFQEVVQGIIDKQNKKVNQHAVEYRCTDAEDRIMYEQLLHE